MGVILEGLEIQVADMLFERGAIKFGAFPLKLHMENPGESLSPIYFMLRTDKHPNNPGPLTKEDMRLIGDLLERQLWNISFGCFAGIPEAGEPFADQVGRLTRNWRHHPRRLKLEKKSSGEERHVTGLLSRNVKPGSWVLLIDDLVTRADTKLEAVQVLEARDLVVRHILVLVDRQQGGTQQLERAGYCVNSVFKLDELMRYYVIRDFITSCKAEEVMHYIAANQVA